MSCIKVMYLYKSKEKEIVLFYLQSIFARIQGRQRAKRKMPYILIKLWTQFCMT